MQDDGRKSLHHFDIEIVPENYSIWEKEVLYLCCFLIFKNQLRQGHILQTVLQARMETVGLAEECVFWVAAQTFGQPLGTSDSQGLLGLQIFSPRDELHHI